MDEPILSELPKGFSEALLGFCEAPPPEPAFVSGLERQLLERQVVLRRAAQDGRSARRLWKQFSGSFTRRKWQYAAVLLLTALAMTLFAIGPQRVLAQVQHWLGYIPGIGFVDLKQARILVEPVSISRDGVTLNVEQVLAEPDETLIVFSSAGLPPDNVGADSSRFDTLPRPLLTLPDGSVLKAVRQELSYGGGKIEFPALPEGVFRVTFQIDRLPLLPAGAAPEGWQAALLLRPGSGELPDDLFPQPYSPKDARVTVNGVTAHIQQVAQTAHETAVQVQFNWEDLDWKFSSVNPPFELRDDRGNVYQQLPSNAQVASASIQEARPLPAEGTAVPAPTSEATFRFPALSLAAREATLHLPSIGFFVPDAPGFTFDPGLDPQIGQTWELNTTLEVSGIPVQLTGARLVQDDQTYPDDPPLYGLEFIFQTPALPQRSLDAFLLNTDLDDLEGYRGSFGGMREPGVFKVEMLFTELPREPLNITFEGVRITLYGPWDLHWQVPEMGQVTQPIREVHPEGVTATQAGVTLQIDQTTFTDQVSVVRLSATGLQEGGRLLNVLGYDPSTFDITQVAYTLESQLYLETGQGQRIELAQNVSWQPEGEAQDDPGRLVFGPLSPQAELLSLHVPAVELFLPDQAAFEITLPEGLSFHAEEFKVTAYGQNEGQETQTRWVSDSWEVDIPVEVAGYPLHFTQAQVEHDEQADPPYRLFLKAEPPAREQGGPYLNRLRFLEIEQPDGQILQIDPARQNSGMISYPSGGIGLLEPGSMAGARVQAVIVLDVTAADRVDLLAGRYRVELNGVTVWAPGPWELDFSLSGH